MLSRIRSSSLLLAVGLLLLVGGLVLSVYPRWGEWQHSLQVHRPADVALLSQDALRLSPTALLATPTPPAMVESSPTPTIVPTTTSYGQPVWIVIPSIDLDSRVVEMPNDHGYYYVPGWDIGHHTDSPNPGEPGNSAYAGHVSTIDAGHVFARLKDVKVGDCIYIYTNTHRTDWVVNAIGTYQNDDATFLAPTHEARATLYTCTGTFDWSTHDYSHRLAVTADLFRVEPRTKTNE